MQLPASLTIWMFTHSLEIRTRNCGYFIYLMSNQKNSTFPPRTQLEFLPRHHLCYYITFLFTPASIFHRQFIALQSHVTHYLQFSKRNDGTTRIRNRYQRDSKITSDSHRSRSADIRQSQGLDFTQFFNRNNQGKPEFVKQTDVSFSEKITMGQNQRRNQLIENQRRPFTPRPTKDKVVEKRLTDWLVEKVGNVVNDCFVSPVVIMVNNDKSVKIAFDTIKMNDRC